MSRLDRFTEFRFIGLRDTMRYYDCEDAFQYEELQSLVVSGDLVENNRLQSFAPDTEEEAANRGFRPRRSNPEPET